MGLVGADLADRLLDPLLDLVQVLIDQLRTNHSHAAYTTGVAGRDMSSDGVVRAPRQFGGVTKRPSQIVGFQDFHDFLCRLQVVPPQGAISGFSTAEHT